MEWRSDLATPGKEVSAMIQVGDEVVHQGQPGRFTVVKIEPSPSMNVYSRILTIRGADGASTRVLDTAVRVLPPKAEPAPTAEAAAAAKPAE
jgi:hypothetical protein